jgi:glucose/arabinose dehydrogenase/PKD repeat protein
MNARRSFLLLAILALSSVRESAAALPPDFTDTLVTPVPSPTALAFLPDGRLLITEQGGRVRILKSNALLGTPALVLGGRVCANSERGLLGVAVDPEFEQNRFVYLYYTYARFGVCPEGEPANPENPNNRLSRFVLPAGSDRLQSQSEVVLIDNIPSPNSNHNSGDLQFGPDGLLYVSIGDGACDYARDSGCAGLNDAARDRHVLLGKIARITRDGAIPDTNPFRGAGTARCNVTGRTTPGQVCREIFATGLRNPFRIAFDPNTTTPRFFINDVGQNAFEEINEGHAGADYGWNCLEGPQTNSSSGPCAPIPAGLTPPILAYGHNTAIPWSSGQGWPGGTPPRNCHAVTGGAFVPAGAWPGYDGAYLWSDFVCGGIFALRTAPGGFAAADFATDLGRSSAVALRFGPDQALYYTSYANGGEVRRIAYTGNSVNHPPTAAMSATPEAGPAPLAVTFDASASSDPDSDDTLTYLWNFGDGSPPLTTAATTSVHTYAAAGTFQATLRVRDNHLAESPPAVRQIAVGNDPPVPTIVTPAASDLFSVGQEITLSGSATDHEDGALPASALTWRVLLHHNDDHTHPYLGPVTGTPVAFHAPAPEDLAAAVASFLEIRLTATDSLGLSASTTLFLQPRKAALSIASVPTGLQLRANDSTVFAPATITSWAALPVTLEAPLTQVGSGTAYQFQSWSDGGAARHLITTPAAGATFTATYTPVPDGQLALGGDRFRIAVAWRSATNSGVGHAAALTTDSGYFWFFAAENIELLVKVLDGCGLNGKYWFFAAGLTDVATEISVTDTATGATRTYRNALGTAFLPVQDTGAFSTCP